MKRFAIPAATALVAALTALATVPAQAEGLYLGGSLSAPQYQDDINGIHGGGSGVGGSLYGGYRFNPNFALESGYLELGRNDDNGTGRIRSKGLYLDAVGFLPLSENWSALGSIGVARTRVETSLGDSTGNGLKLGLGAEYALNKQVSLRGEWQRVTPDVFGDKPAIDGFNFGVRMGF